MSPRMFNAPQKAAAKKILLAWYQEHCGENVRKARPMQSEGLRMSDGFIYHVPRERWKPGDVAVRLFKVKKPDGSMFLTCADFRLAKSYQHDVIERVIEFRRSVKATKTNWTGLEGNHFTIGRIWPDGRTSCFTCATRDGGER